MLWTSSDATTPPQNNWTGVNFDGSWSFQTDQPGPFNLAFYTADNGDCSGQIRTTPVPSWFVNKPLAGSDPGTITPPAAADQVEAGTSGVVACLGATELPTAPCAVPTTVLSGRVITTGRAPVAAACIFILAPEGAIAQAVADADGAWTIDTLPVDYPVVVGVVPPFEGSFGPCANDGPPPMPGPGELQAEMYTNTWVDLSDPDLQDDPFGWGTQRGAVAVTNSASGLDVCLTTDPGNVVPRPACDVPTPTPTETTTTTTTTTATATTTATTTATATATATETAVVATSSPPTPSEPELAVTGAPILGYAAAAAGLLTFGLLLLLWSRVRKPATGSH